MNLNINASRLGGRFRRGFSIVEGLVAMGIVGIAFVSLYSGLTYGFQRIQFSRENQRATQIMVEKMETLRLYTWDQLTTPGFLPEKFTASYYVNDGEGDSGTLYRGSLRMEVPTEISANYQDRLRRITVNLQWKTGSTTRFRTFSTYVTQGGLYTYVY